MKNTGLFCSARSSKRYRRSLSVYYLAARTKTSSMEDFGKELANYLLDNHTQVSVVHIDIARKPWSNIVMSNNTRHPTSYVRTAVNCKWRPSLGLDTVPSKSSPVYKIWKWWKPLIRPSWNSTRINWRRCLKPVTVCSARRSKPRGPTIVIRWISTKLANRFARWSSTCSLNIIRKVFNTPFTPSHNTFWTKWAASRRSPWPCRTSIAFRWIWRVSANRTRTKSLCDRRSSRLHPMYNQPIEPEQEQRGIETLIPLFSAASFATWADFFSQLHWSYVASTVLQ